MKRIATLSAAALLAGCGTNVYEKAYPTLSDGRLEVLALDRERDIVVLGRESSTPVEGSLPEFEEAGYRFDPKYFPPTAPQSP